MPFPFLKNPNVPVPADERSVIKKDRCRFTVLTEWLIRIEYDEEGHFEDRPTKTVNNRNFPLPRFIVTEDEKTLQIRTDHFELRYRGGPLTPYTLSVDVLGGYSNHDNTWHFGDKPQTLKGTCRTLDRADGEVPLEEGLCSKIGYAVLDDSLSPVILEDGWVDKRRTGVVDIYYFGYGHNYRACIRDFYRLTGAPPLLPRFALGNWWSRYYAYTQEEYKELMTRFAGEDLPFSVAVLDMDWHITEVEERFGRGWTGYTWNEKLFPDHEELLRWLHERNLKVTLNLHPADGVKAYEKMYLPMAKALGVDADREDPIVFDISNRDFMAAYFEYLHHPMEDEGVDFWWIDWQSGAVSQAEGLDPLWMLNHYHSMDSARNGKRSFIFSRYSGPGSHRYPVGFSGDTCITWASLEFQPYFTAAASNIGYGWWSHDIGGHMHGIKDEELMIRWLQFGVFSPINRLHSSNSLFTFKEPWYYGPVAEKAMGIFLRLRHELIPYLYTMNYRCATELEPLMQPMYYSHPEFTEAYIYKNQYWLGSELIVAPITRRTTAATGRAFTDLWLPQGTWTDFFSGLVYRGGKEIRVWRTPFEYPVFAKAGAIVPLASRIPHQNSTDNPRELRLLVFPGGSGAFSLYEDAGEGNAWRDGAYAETRIEFSKSGDGGVLSVKLKGDISTLPEERSYVILFRGVIKPEEVRVVLRRGGDSLTIAPVYHPANNTLEISIPPMKRGGEFTLEVSVPEPAGAAYRLEERLIKFLVEAQIPFDLKDRIFKIINLYKNSSAEDAWRAADLIASLTTIISEPDILSVLLEMICA
jgi:alpha-glucosidase (family GH31 glycosyl hydrolase)